MNVEAEGHMAETTNAIHNTNDTGDAWGQASFGSDPIVVKMPVEKHAVYYKMDHKRRGIAIIFNHKNFDVHNLKPRNGTNVDCENLKSCFQKLGFDVKDYHDFTYEQLTQAIQQVASYNHSDCDCLIITVLSHGEMGILYAKDSPYKPERLWTQFTADKCPTLAGKPKLFFIQACQGDKLDGGVTVRTEVDGGPHTYKIPAHADFLIAYSTIPGFYSWRNTTQGSWFVQALCAELKLRGQGVDLLTLLTFVKQRVAIHFESNTPFDITMHRQKQIPCTTTMLTRLVKF